MFDANTIIDTVQNSKKQALRMLVLNSTVLASLESVIDKQTQWTKEALELSQTTYKTLVDEQVKLANAYMPREAVNFAEQFMSTWAPVSKKSR